MTHVTTAGWLPRTGISSRTLRSVIEYGLPLPFLVCFKHRIAKLKFMPQCCFYFEGACQCSFILPWCPVDIFALFFMFHSAYLSHINLNWFDWYIHEKFWKFRQSCNFISDNWWTMERAKIGDIYLTGHPEMADFIAPGRSNPPSGMQSYYLRSTTHCANRRSERKVMTGWQKSRGKIINF